MSNCGAHTLSVAGPKTGKWYMVVEDDRLVTVMDTLHILVGLVVGGAPVHMLHHVQVGGYALGLGSVIYDTKHLPLI